VYDIRGPFGTEPVTDPTGPLTGSFHTNRGGGWLDRPDTLRIADRSWDTDSGASWLGFRVVRTIPD
jgi:formylglycine-generating enzyme required for sulfatase activity